MNFKSIDKFHTHIYGLVVDIMIVRDSILIMKYINKIKF
jgi:hypothetical protein